jgi:hypothetical protein
MGNPVSGYLTTTPLSQKAKDAYGSYKKGKKAYDYYKLVIATVDEDTRSGALFKLGLKFSTDVIGKLLGTSITSNPYYAYHKVHIEMLVQALNVSTMQEKALDSLNRAISAADSTNSFARSLSTYQERKNALGWDWLWNLNTPVQWLTESRTNATATQKQMADAGWSVDRLGPYVNEALENHRARWAEMTMEALELLAMTDSEYRMADAAMTTYNQKMKKMSESGNLGRIGAYGADQKRQWEEFDRAVNPSVAKPQQAVSDPAGFARKQRDSVDTVASSLSRMCDFVWSDDVLTPGAYAMRTKN